MQITQHSGTGEGRYRPSAVTANVHRGCRWLWILAAGAPLPAILTGCGWYGSGNQSRSLRTTLTTPRFASSRWRQTQAPFEILVTIRGGHGENSRSGTGAGIMI